MSVDSLPKCRFSTLSASVVSSCHENRPTHVPFLIHYTRLSVCLGLALSRLQASGLAEFITRKERGRAASTFHTHTHRQARLTVSRYNTTLVSPLRLCIGPAREAGLSSDTRRGMCHLVKKKKRKIVCDGKP